MDKKEMDLRAKCYLIYLKFTHGIAEWAWWAVGRLHRTEDEGDV